MVMFNIFCGLITSWLKRALDFSSDGVSVFHVLDVCFGKMEFFKALWK